MEIDPWASKGVQNYKEICEKFGLDIVDYTKLPNPTHLHRRGIIFAHRDLDNVLESRKAGRPFGVLSGLMPSGQIHLGHKMVIDQAKWFQELGGDVTITDGGADLATINATKVSGSLASTGSFGALTIVDGVTDTLSPIINGTVDLGGSSNKWKDLYVVGTGSFGALTNDGEVYDTHLTGSFTGSFNGQVNLVDVSGTPSDNQISTFTDANTVQGESNLTFDGTNLLIASTGKLYLNDAGCEHISGNGSILSIAAGSEIDLTATDIDINGAVDVSGNLTVGGNLDVNGTVTTIDTVNVMVSESFSTHASGSSTAVDGGIGPNTIRAAKNLKDWELQVERSGFYWNLVFDGSRYTKRTSQVKFIRGWIRRCFNLQ